MKHIFNRFLLLFLVFSVAFTMPGMTLYSKATENISGSVFDDVRETDWFCSSVSFVLNKGVMVGMGNNLFSPNSNVTRAQFATIIYRLSGSPDVEYTPQFSDVSDGTYYSDAVIWASQENIGIIFGYGNGQFRPNNSITREEMAALLYRYAVYRGFTMPPEPTVPEQPEDTSSPDPANPENSESPDASEIPMFPDVISPPPDTTVTENITANSLNTFADYQKISNYALTPMQWIVDHKIMVGTNKGYLEPQNSASRAAAAAVLERLYYLFMDGELADLDFSASCESVSAEIENENTGTFKITVTNAQAALPVASVQAIVYSRENKQDMYIYTLSPITDGIYQVNANVKNHNYSPGVYTVEAAVLLENGVRLILASTTIELKDLWNMILVNPWNKMPNGFTVELADVGYGHYVDKRIVSDLNAMFNAMRSSGLNPAICSSYRTQQYQETLFARKLKHYLSQGFSYDAAYAEASKWVAIPGTSEHQLGLAVDIVDNSYWVLDSSQEKTAVQQWLMKNSYKYGFILRYPSSKSAITGIGYEPWHYRYVGKTVAKEIYEQNICLEEYLNILN